MAIDARGEAARLVIEIDERVTRLKELLTEGRKAAPAEDLGSRVLAQVLKRGGSVSREELHGIADECGMDRRGLGGFFRESGQSSLTQLPGTDRIVLTPYGADWAQRYLNRTATKYTVAEPGLARVAEPSFAEDWDSPEDAIYDDA